VADLVLLVEAIQESTYTQEHITWLLRKGRIAGRKVGGVWLVDLESLKQYEQRMKELGTKKHDSTKDE
jgi:hypothetical protein